MPGRYSLAVFTFALLIGTAAFGAEMRQAGISDRRRIRRDATCRSPRRCVPAI